MSLVVKIFKTCLNDKAPLILNSSNVPYFELYLFIDVFPFLDWVRRFTSGVGYYPTVKIFYVPIESAASIPLGHHFIGG